MNTRITDAPILVTVEGGFGNQLSQIALAYYLAQVQARPVLLNTVLYHQRYPRKQIQDFATDGALYPPIQQLINTAISSQKTLNTLLKYSLKLRLSLIEKILSKIKQLLANRGIPLPNLSIVQKLGRIHLTDSIGTISEHLPFTNINQRDFRTFSHEQLRTAIESYPADKPCLVNGYWNTGTTLNVVTPLVRPLHECFAIHTMPLSSELSELLQTPHSIAIHIRRTDYLKQSNNFLSCSNAYYSRACDIILNMHPKARCYVFTDDPLWVDTHLAIKSRNLCIIRVSNNPLFFPKDNTVINNHKDFWEFCLMRHCTHHIIANSTFSWSAALYSLSDAIRTNHPVQEKQNTSIDTKGKIICMPSRWQEYRENPEMHIPGAVVLDTVTGDRI